MAQAMRAILLASATAATLIGRRSIRRVSQGRFVPCWRAYRMTAMAPATSRSCSSAVRLLQPLASILPLRRLRSASPSDCPAASLIKLQPKRPTPFFKGAYTSFSHSSALRACTTFTSGSGIMFPCIIFEIVFMSVFEEAQQLFRLRATFGFSEELIASVEGQHLDASDAIRQATQDKQPQETSDI